LPVSDNHVNKMGVTDTLHTMDKRREREYEADTV